MTLIECRAACRANSLGSFCSKSTWDWIPCSEQEPLFGVRKISVIPIATLIATTVMCRFEYTCILVLQFVLVNSSNTPATIPSPVVPDAISVITTPPLTGIGPTRFGYLNRNTKLSPNTYQSTPPSPELWPLVFKTWTTVHRCSAIQATYATAASPLACRRSSASLTSESKSTLLHGFKKDLQFLCIPVRVCTVWVHQVSYRCHCTRSIFAL